MKKFLLPIFLIILSSTLFLFLVKTADAQSIEGDIDGDGDVDIFDYNLLVTNFGATGAM
ncbi:hypothetical protein IID21_03790 [Patescibacteria group bacterium]|nr:hypothetical protein [Patescibacteria group bacterium]